VEHDGDKNAHKVLVGIPVGTRALGRVRRRRGSSMEFELEGCRMCVGLNCLGIGSGSALLWERYWASCMIWSAIGFSRRILQHVISFVRTVYYIAVSEVLCVLISKKRIYLNTCEVTPFDTHTRTHTYTQHTHTQTHTHTTCIHTHTQTHTYTTCIHTHTQHTYTKTHTHTTCIHTHIHIQHTYTQTHTHTQHAYTHTHTHNIHTHKHIHTTCIHTHTHTTYIHTHIYTQHAYTHTHTHTTYIHTHTHTHTYTHIKFYKKFKEFANSILLDKVQCVNMTR